MEHAMKYVVNEVYIKAIFYYIQEERGSFALMDSGKKDFI